MTGNVLAMPVEEAPVRSGSVYLDAYLAPFRSFLERETVTEILVNRPGEVWIEDAENSGMLRHAMPEVTDALIQRLAEQVARQSHQAINREHPLLAATLPADLGAGGARMQIAGPPATRAHWAMAIRSHRMVDLPLDAYDSGPIVPRAETPMPDAQARANRLSARGDPTASDRADLGRHIDRQDHLPQRHAA